VKTHRQRGGKACGASESNFLKVKRGGGKKYSRRNNARGRGGAVWECSGGSVIIDNDRRDVQENMFTQL